MSKYDPLRAYLDSCGGVDVPLSFADIEAVLGFDLPYSARHHRHWWGNNAFGHAQSRSWMKARYKVAKIDLAGERVVFTNYEAGPVVLENPAERVFARAAASRRGPSAEA